MDPRSKELLQNLVSTLQETEDAAKFKGASDHERLLELSKQIQARVSHLLFTQHPLAPELQAPLRRTIAQITAALVSATGLSPSVVSLVAAALSILPGDDDTPGY